MRVLIALTLALLAQTAAFASYRTPSWIQLDSPAYVVNESDTNLVITFVRSGEFREGASFDYSLEDGTAETGVDFRAKGGTINFQAGHGYATLNVPITWDTESEGDEHFTIQLSNPGHNTQLVQTSATITIEDAEPASASVAKLNIRPGVNQTLEISWPSAATASILQRSANPAAGAWETVETAPKQVGNEWIVAEPLTGPAYFYRLQDQTSR